MTREQHLARVFVELADTLVAEFDVLDLLHLLAERTVDLLEADAVGLMLADQRGNLRVLAATSHEARVLELFELQNSEGPCLDCYSSGEPVVNIDSDDAAARWPKFAAACTKDGFRSVHALPLRLRNETIGAMNLFCADNVTLTDDDLAVGQALADVATIGLLQERAVRQKEMVAEQLQSALNSRVLIEQAKGVLAERANIEVDEAFNKIRAYSRSLRLSLSGVAGSIIAGEIGTSELMSAGSDSSTTSI